MDIDLASDTIKANVTLSSLLAEKVSPKEANQPAIYDMRLSFTP